MKPPPNPVGVAIVGCGSNGQIHADGLAKLVEDGEVRAVASVDPSDAARAAANRNCSFELSSADVEDAVANPAVDAVFVTSPTATHADLVLAAIRNGKAIMCEKPLAPNFAEVQSLVGAVVDSGVVAQVGFHSRFNPLFTHLADLVNGGDLGAPLGYVLREDQFWPTGSIVAGHSSWRSDASQAGGGALLEHTIHGCDLLVRMFGQATSVSARARSLFGFAVEDMVAAQVQHESGVIGTIATVFNGVEGREERRLEVFLEQATIEVTGDFIIGAPEDSLTIHRPRQVPDHPDLEAIRADHFRSFHLHRDDFIFYQYLADRSFIRSVRAGTPASPGFLDALAAHALVDAAYRSSASDGVPCAPAHAPL